MIPKWTSAVLMAMIILPLLSGCSYAASASGGATPTTAARATASAGALATPEKTVEGFYAWYLGYAGTGTTGQMRNPLVDRAYRTSEYLSPDFVKKMDQIIASFDKGGYDPFLCAQDVPNKVTIDSTSIAENVASISVSTSFPGHSFWVSLLKERDRWRITNVQCSRAEKVPATPNPTVMFVPSRSAPANVPQTSGWRVYRNSQYEFQIRYPDGWAYQEVTAETARGSFGPENLKLTVFFMPQAWADGMKKNQTPDPNSPGIAPFSLEVTMGTKESYRQLYLPPSSSEKIAFNGRAATMEIEKLSEELSITRYLFEHPNRPDLRLTFIDPISGFPERAKGNNQVLSMKAPMLGTLEWK